ncbi:MAG: phage tail assembly chaperone [Achromobacter pulmonis]
MHYSATLNAFLPSELKESYEIGTGWPSDAVAVGQDVFEEFALQSPPPGKFRVAGPDGLPAWRATDGNESVMDEAQARAWRDGEITRVTWLRDRHRDETEMGVPQTLTVDQYKALLGFIQSLRDWPSSDGFPASGRPVAPGFASDGQE